MASMLLGWTLADVMNALELDGYEDLGTLHGVTEHRLKLNSIHTELEHHLSPYPGLECWLSHRQDSSIDLRDPVVIGVPTMFGGRMDSWHGQARNLQGMLSGPAQIRTGV